MTKIMRAKGAVSVVHHENASYRPNRKGEFEIPDHHVEAMRTHGLRTLDEIELAEAAPRVKDLVAENAALKARVAELEGKKK